MEKVTFELRLEGNDGNLKCGYYLLLRICYLLNLSPDYMKAMLLPI